MDASTRHRSRPTVKNNRLIRIACAALFASGLLSNAHANPEKQSEGYLAIVQGALPATSTATDAISESLMFKGADIIAKQINREGQLTRIGEYEWEAKAATRNRKDRQILVDQNSQDYEIGLARTLRLPSKGRLDEQMGSTYDSISNLTRMDGWHETARVLNQRWYDCVQAGSSLELGRRQLASLSEFESQQAKRLAAGEISAVQHEQAQLELAQARLNLNTLQSEADLARKALVSDFPLLGSATDLQACVAPATRWQPWRKPQTAPVIPGLT